MTETTHHQTPVDWNKVYGAFAQAAEVCRRTVDRGIEYLGPHPARCRECGADLLGDGVRDHASSCIVGLALKALGRMK